MIPMKTTLFLLAASAALFLAVGPALAEEQIPVSLPQGDYYVIVDANEQHVEVWKECTGNSQFDDGSGEDGAVDCNVFADSDPTGVNPALLLP